MGQIDEERERLLQSIRDAATRSGRTHLTILDFRTQTGISKRTILHHFDSWTEACSAAGVRPGIASPDNIRPYARRSKGKEHALAEVKRVASKLGVKALSMAQFNGQHTDVSAKTVALLWGGWHRAIEAAGLRKHPKAYDEIPLAELAREFLNAFRELGKVPSLTQLSRRSAHGEYLFSEKHGGYATFKKAAIELLLSEEDLDAAIRIALESHLAELRSGGQNGVGPVPAPHARGRHLGFRAFAFAPTYETEVVSLFAAVADELGFEIVAQREAFPDCEARRIVDQQRKRYKRCMIEYELRSSDYRKHKHSEAGCDLVVCWEHDWKECPLEVLELKQAIRLLPGWK